MFVFALKMKVALKSVRSKIKSNSYICKNLFKKARLKSVILNEKKIKITFRNLSALLVIPQAGLLHVDNHSSLFTEVNDFHWFETMFSHDHASYI